MEWPSSDKGIVSEGELVCFKQGPRWARASSSTGDQHLPPPPSGPAKSSLETAGCTQVLLEMEDNLHTWLHMQGLGARVIP